VNQRSEASFEGLFNTYYEALTNYAYTFMNNSDEAEDIVQQVYINLWENRMKLEIHTSARSFLYKAVHNSCLNRIKHLKIKSSHHQELAYERLNDSSHTAQDHKELMNRLHLALDSLPEQCRIIFEMSRFEQLKYQEIANQLNLSIKTVENQMGKALKIMRAELKDYLPIILLILSKYYHG
jgi:RNA polymerase sigma-70 factor (ECF subfamily)